MAATGYTTGDPNKVNKSGDTMSGNAKNGGTWQASFWIRPTGF